MQLANPLSEYVRACFWHLDRVYRAPACAEPLSLGRREAWEHCQKWIELCWRGDVSEVIGLLEAEQMVRGEIS